MYLPIILALTVILPLVTAIYIWIASPGSGLLAAIGPAFVFWAGGVRLFLAGVKQSTDPAFTAKGIFGSDDRGALKAVRELGFANLGMGLVGLGSFLFPGWVVPAAIIGAVFLGLDGINHAMTPGRTRNETIAMVTDLFVAGMLILFLIGQAV